MITRKPDCNEYIVLRTQTCMENDKVIGALTTVCKYSLCVYCNDCDCDDAFMDYVEETDDISISEMPCCEYIQSFVPFMQSSPN